jgi:hypothetical protein
MRDAGKIMLHKEKLAKKYVAVLAHELETCEDPVIRNNVVVVMCDLCVRYCTGQGKLWPVSAGAVRVQDVSLSAARDFSNSSNAFLFFGPHFRSLWPWAQCHRPNLAAAGTARLSTRMSRALPAVSATPTPLCANRPCRS